MSKYGWTLTLLISAMAFSTATLAANDIKPAETIANAQEPKDSAEQDHEQHGAHEHGKAQLTIAVNDKTIEARFNSPMANIVGFEHAPANEQERDKLKAAKAIMEQGLNLLSFNADANCDLTHTEIISALFLNTNIPSSENQHTHNDLEVTWTYECANPNKIANADIKLFSAFSTGLEELQVEWLTEKGASARELTQDESISF